MHWVSIKHAVPAEVRLYDRLFIDEAPDSHKEKNFLDFMNKHSLETVTGFMEPSLATATVGDKFQFQRLGYFNVDKDSTADKIIFNKTVGLKDAWEEKGKKEANVLMATQKEINKYVKEKDAVVSQNILESIVSNIKSIDNYSLINQTIVKNIKNDNNALLFANLILLNSDKISSKDIDAESLQKLYGMSLKSQLAGVRIVALENLINDVDSSTDFKSQILEMKEKEKNENVLALINSFDV